MKQPKVPTGAAPPDSSGANVRFVAVAPERVTTRWGAIADLIPAACKRGTIDPERPLDLPCDEIFTGPTPRIRLATLASVAPEWVTDDGRGASFAIPASRLAGAYRMTFVREEIEVPPPPEPAEGDEAFAPVGTESPDADAAVGAAGSQEPAAPEEDPTSIKPAVAAELEKKDTVSPQETQQISETLLRRPTPLPKTRRVFSSMPVFRRKDPPTPTKLPPPKPLSIPKPVSLDTLDLPPAKQKPVEEAVEQVPSDRVGSSTGALPLVDNLPVPGSATPEDGGKEPDQEVPEPPREPSHLPPPAPPVPPSAQIPVSPILIPPDSGPTVVPPAAKSPGVDPEAEPSPAGSEPPLHPTTTTPPVAKVVPIEHVASKGLAEIPEQESLQALFLTEEALTIERVAELCVGLPGIHACLFTHRSRVVAAHNVPDSVDIVSLSAHAMEMLSAMRASSAKMGLGAIPAVTIHSEKGPVSFFSHRDLCLLVLHKDRGFVPGVREKLHEVVLEVSRGRVMLPA